MPVQLLEAAVLVAEHAVVALMAKLRLVEVPAVLCLEGLLVGLYGLLSELVLAVGIAAV